jgi:hypothetical protein
MMSYRLPVETLRSKMMLPAQLVSVVVGGWVCNARVWRCTIAPFLLHTLTPCTHSPSRTCTHAQQLQTTVPSFIEHIHRGLGERFALVDGINTAVAQVEAEDSSLLITTTTPNDIALDVILTACVPHLLLTSAQPLE